MESVALGSACEFIVKGTRRSYSEQNENRVLSSISNNC